MYNNLEQAVIKDMGKEFEKSLNSEMSYWIELKYWLSQGWAHVMLPKLQDNLHAVDITNWLENNGYVDRENYYRDGREFVFRDPEMATAFVLKWV